VNCWHCGHQLIWGGDHDIEEEDEEYCMETNLSCPNCGSFVLVFLPKDTDPEPHPMYEPQVDQKTKQLIREEKDSDK
jgi:DNA-directed RNA polymerase subunit RPC12/RpoP